jgi:hypothetical protein
MGNAGEERVLGFSGLGARVLVHRFGFGGSGVLKFGFEVREPNELEPGH